MGLVPAGSIVLADPDGNVFCIVDGTDYRTYGRKRRPYASALHVAVPRWHPIGLCPQGIGKLAVLISADDLASLEETLEILGTPGAVQAIREGQADAAAGRFVDNDETKARYGIA